MIAEFTNESPGIVRSNHGFVVMTKIGGGIRYEDAAGSYKIDSEWCVGGIILYRQSPSNGGNTTTGEDEIFARVIRALKYQSYTVEVM